MTTRRSPQPPKLTAIPGSPSAPIRPIIQRTPGSALWLAKKRWTPGATLISAKQSHNGSEEMA